MRAALILLIALSPLSLWGKLGGTPAELTAIYGRPDEVAGNHAYALWIQRDGLYEVRAEFRNGRCVFMSCTTKRGARFEAGLVPRLIAAFTDGVALQPVPAGGTVFGGYTIRPGDYPSLFVSGITPIGRVLTFELPARDEDEGDMLIALVESEARRIGR